MLARVAEGEEIEITNRDGVVARLMPPQRRVSQLGFDRGRVRVAEDFDAPLPDQLQTAFDA